MPSWRERVQQRLSEACCPRFRMHFDSRRDEVSVFEPGFVDNLKIICEQQGCKAIVAETHPRSEFSRVLFHDRPQDLEPIPVRTMRRKGKRAKSSKNKAKPGVPGPNDKVCRCWVLE
uniref:Uncharacterized protein n=1 Tax=Pyrodinium bahamense TaxID=73915 RepID=A0A7S0ADE5_9DINO|mmetsp:Transcript_31988/g.88104  ORF Transcript_31988/g.88104 Transcript_31988/m.88104 type:complete len:117 (+) Transcript_31988:102-452(+)